MDQNQGQHLTVYTVGHSNHGMADFLELLERFGVQRLVDVRSHPYSRWVPHFRKRPLAAALADAGVAYEFLGDALGGRPEGAEFYDAEGRVDYDLRARAGDFRDGIERLLGLAAERRTAIMCAEEDPGRCHRRLLIAPALRELGARVVHVGGDGGTREDPGDDDGQIGLFE